MFRFQFLRLLLIICFGAVSGGELHAQMGIGSNYIQGTLLSMDTGDPIGGAVVGNSTTRNTAVSGADGSFRIYAKKDDRVVVTAAGYEPYFFTSTGYNGAAGTIRLHVIASELNEVIVRPRYYQYQADSARRASTYQRTMARQRTSSAMSPVSLLAERFNARSKQIRRFQQEFNAWEDQRFIDVRYNTDIVTQLTGLRGDSLAAFMNAYPMPYDYARAASELELKMWIRNNYREWIVRPFVPAVRPELVSDSIRVEVPATAEGR